MRRVLVAAVFLMALVASACSPIGNPPGPAPLRYRDDIFTGVTETQNVTYGSAVNQAGQTVTLRMDVYEPTGDTVSARPAIVWVHGGSFCCGNEDSPELIDQARYFSRKGYVNVSITYRLVASGCPGSDLNACLTGIAQAREDAQTAVRYLRANASRYRIDTNRIAIGGSSAGAITALNVGYSPENPGPGQYQGYSSEVGAVQSLSGAELASGPIDAGDAPALLFHGTADNAVPYAWATSTVDRAEAAGVPIVLRTWEGAGHVPYTQFRDQILTETRNFFYNEMGLANAAR